MKLGTNVGVKVTVGEAVGVVVEVAVGVVVGSTTLPVPRNTPKTIAAPIAMTTTINPNAVGRLMVTSGIRGVLTDVLVLTFSVAVKVRPQTRQRVAVSLRRVPHVGQIFPLAEEPAGEMIGLSGLIGSNR